MCLCWVSERVLLHDAGGVTCLCWVSERVLLHDALHRAGLRAGGGGLPVGRGGQAQRHQPLLGPAALLLPL